MGKHTQTHNAEWAPDQEHQFPSFSVGVSAVLNHCPCSRTSKKGALSTFRRLEFFVWQLSLLFFLSSTDI